MESSPKVDREVESGSFDSVEKGVRVKVERTWRRVVWTSSLRLEDEEAMVDGIEVVGS